MIFEDRFIYFPEGDFELSPEQMGLDHEDLAIRTEDGVDLHAWYLSCDQLAGVSRRGVLLFFHGNAGNISHRLYNARKLMDLGVDVVLVDYRGYGRSKGKPNEAGLILDARAALAHVLERPGATRDHVVVFGRSLGGAVAVQLVAATDPPVAGLIMESSFTSVPDMARVAMPWIPFAGLLVRTRFDSLSAIRRIGCPLLVVHGEEDSLIPIRMGLRLFEAAPEPKGWFPVPGGDHNDTWLVGGSGYLERLALFLDEIL